MKTIKRSISFIILSGVLLSAPLHAAAEEKTPAPGGTIRGKLTSARETEILGTLEKPQFSTELAWQSPVLSNLNAPQPHRSFKKEIFRPVHPLLEINKKLESK